MDSADVQRLLRSSVPLARVKNKLTIKVEHTGHQFRQFADGYVFTNTNVDQWSLIRTEKRMSPGPYDVVGIAARYFVPYCRLFDEHISIPAILVTLF